MDSPKITVLILAIGLLATTLPPTDTITLTIPVPPSTVTLSSYAMAFTDGACRILLHNFGPPTATGHWCTPIAFGNGAMVAAVHLYYYECNDSAL